MRENRVRTLWGRDKAVVNGWLAIPNVFSAETMAHAGWDSLTIDMQHGVVDYTAAVSMLTAISTTDTTPMVRVPWLDPGIIMKMLDAGAYGVICPMINTRADAELFVSALRYPPRGMRSFGPIRALLHAGPDYARHANDTVFGLAMIETRQALDNLDEILSVEGLDAVYVGPADLSLALGCAPRFDQEEKPVVEAIEMILAKAKEHGVVPCIHNGTAEYALRMVEKGFRFVTVASDARLMAAGAQAAVAAMRGGPEPKGPGTSGTY
ncbi:HpcH/HpaI aldolase family protein [Roseomonas gilardii]|uniref:HpcH/HpaI aldolase family protein n=1 Tax=Roseomonas gilardii TaxID=257708 RepID=UPI00048861D8|nr:aldolase/citrate lyase family protein [Roseomonas gilardii]SUE43455.1 4-hydroxy-2-oxo-heptane-1,7-dioate aldolase [Roseomonas gilardii subsp. rosea]